MLTGLLIRVPPRFFRLKWLPRYQTRELIGIETEDDAASRALLQTEFAQGHFLNSKDFV